MEPQPTVYSPVKICGFTINWINWKNFTWHAGDPCGFPTPHGMSGEGGRHVRAVQVQGRWFWRVTKTLGAA